MKNLFKKDLFKSSQVKGDSFAAKESPLLTGILSAILIFSFTLIPLRALAANSKKNTAVLNFCSNFNSRSAELNAKIQTKQAQIISDSDQKKLKLKSSREKRQANIDAIKLKSDQRLDKRLNNLPAKTQAQKKAVAQFKLEINTAVQSRTVLVNNAIAKFQSGLDNTLLDFQNQTQAAIKNFKIAAETAENKAISDCGKLDPAKVKETFSMQMKAAKDTFQKERRNLAKLDTQLAELKNNRDADIKNANENFASSVNIAAKKLKTEF